MSSASRQSSEKEREGKSSEAAGWPGVELLGVGRQLSESENRFDSVRKVSADFTVCD